MGVIFFEHFAHDTGGFREPRTVPQTLAQHSIENAPLHRLQAIANIGQGPRNNDAHGVVEVRLAHLVIDTHWPNNPNFHL